jgi:hypothetical protein
MQNRMLSLSDIQERRKALQRQLADLDAAERVLLSFADPPIATGLSEPRAVKDGVKTSIKQMILRVLHEAGSAGLNSHGVLARIQNRGLPDYPLANVSPKLSAFRVHGLVDLEGGFWKLTEKGMNEIVSSNS